MTKLLLTLFVLFFSQHALAQTTESVIEATIDNKNAETFNQESKPFNILPGGVLHIQIPKFEHSEYWVKHGQTRAILITKENFDNVFVGVDVETISGEYLISIETNNKQLATYKYVVPKPKNPIFVDDYDTFSKAAPLSEKTTLVDSLLWSNVPPTLPLDYPVKGIWTEKFNHLFEKNNKNSVNNTPSDSSKIDLIDHISITLDAPTTITSPSDATCFSITFDPVEGYTVILDHGMGLFSEISGLNNLTISEQDRVSSGSVIASFNTNDFIRKDKTQSNRTVRWRTILNKSTINPYELTILR